MWITNIFYTVIGLSAGFVVSAGLSTFITSVGVVSRLAQVTQTAGAIKWYEDVFMAGGILGNLYSLYLWPFHLGHVGLGLTGIFVGIFIGCLIGGIAEVLNAIPILYHRAKLRSGLKALVWAMAFGKIAGGIFDFFF